MGIYIFLLHLLLIAMTLKIVQPFYRSLYEIPEIRLIFLLAHPGKNRCQMRSGAARRIVWILALQKPFQANCKLPICLGCPVAGVVKRPLYEQQPAESASVNPRSSL